MSAEEMAVCIGMDALRLCLGHEPKTFTRAQVLRWIQLMGSSQGEG